MAAVRVYGIPNIIESREIFFYNDGKGRLPIQFTGGLLDPKYKIPATYATADEFEQIVIENSPIFGKKVYRYGPKGDIIASTPVSQVAKAAGNKTARVAPAAPKAEVKVYEEVETIAQATEILLDLGVKAADLNGVEAVMSQMLKHQVSFPNLKAEE